MKIQHSIHNPRLLATGFLLAAMTLAMSSLAQADDTTAPDTQAPDTTAPGAIAPATTPGTPPPGTYIWTWKHTKGQVQRTKAVANISGKLRGTELTVQMVTTEVDKLVVADISETGDVSLETSVESSEMTVNGEPRDVNRPPSTHTTVIDKRGIVKTSTADNPKSAGHTIDAVMLMIGSDPLPDHPVKLGESWTVNINNRLMPGTTVPVTSTLQRIMDVNGVDLLKVHSKMSIPRPKEDVEIKVDVNYNVDREKGQVVSENAVIDNVELSLGHGETLPIHMEINQSTVPDAVAPQGRPQPQPQQAQEDVTAE